MPNGNGWHTPGSEAAVFFGCRCPVIDNHHGRRGLECPSAGWLIAQQCPLHGSPFEGTTGRWPGPERSRRSKPVAKPAFKTFRCTAQRELVSPARSGLPEWTSTVGVPAFELWAEDEARAEQKAKRILGTIKHQVALHVCVVEV